MRTNKFINKILAVGVLCGSVGFSSCEDFLTVLPTNQITEEDFWQSQTDLDNVRAAVYRHMASADVTSRILYWGELRSDNMTLNDMTQQGIQHLQQGILMPTEGMFDWSPMYTGINYCNLVLEQGDRMTEPGNEVDPTFRQSDWRPIKAEMLTMRALYYFYLVRAYRDVPYVTASVRTDEEARARTDGATQGVNILGTLIEQLEEVWPYAADNYGSAMDNTGRITRRGVHALLADMYLWRGCMLLNSSAKGDVVVGTEGDTLTDASCTTLSNECFTKAIAHCDSILNYLRREYDEEQELNGGMNTMMGRVNYTPLEDDYPYMLRMNNYGTGGTDLLYSQLWGPRRYSSEAIFQLNYDATSKVTNSTLNTYCTRLENGSPTTGYMTASSMLASSAASSYDPSRGFGMTDVRMLETLNYSTGSSSLPQIHKHLLSSLTIADFYDMTEGLEASYSSSSEHPWPIYRLSDIMLIKAEAIARSMASTTQASTTTTDAGYPLIEGFKLVNSIFARSNPRLESTTNATDDVESQRLDDDYATKSGSVKTAADLLTLVYNERQRDFVAEGKRWFDIVRQCEATNATTDVLTNYISLSTTVRNRLRQLLSLYNPIYSEEIRINGVDYGGNLKQNPVWDRYTTK